MIVAAKMPIARRVEPNAPWFSGQEADTGLVQFEVSEYRSVYWSLVDSGISRSVFDQGTDLLLDVRLPKDIRALNDGRSALQAASSSTSNTDFTVSIDVVSNDRYFITNSLWGMYGDKTSPLGFYGSQAAEAWNAGYVGSMKVVVGDLDTGIDYTHPDLYRNVWINQGELPRNMALVDTDHDGLITFIDLNNPQNRAFVSDINRNGFIDAGDLLKDARWVDGVDTDRNGYIDDLVGWDFVNNDNNPFDDNGHGTHTAGTIGAMGGNSIGVAGVDWNVQIMALKFLGKSGSGNLSDAVRALDYYTQMSAQYSGIEKFVGTNNSWSGGGYSQSLYDAIVRLGQQGGLFIAAAGNGGGDGIGDNNYLTPNYPSNYNTTASLGFDNVIAVAAIDQSGNIASFSNYGSTTVDIGAPGVSVFSTVPNGYSSFSGTSMATPHVTGAMALLASIHPEYTASQLKDALLHSAAVTGSLYGKTVSNGRLDISALLGLDTPANEASLTIYGSGLSDRVIASPGNDVIYGISQNPARNALGKGTIDILTGNGGNDVFVIGDSRGVFYNDGSATQPGYSDYACITDFSPGDKIQLKAGTYFTAPVTAGTNSGIGIFWDSNASGRIDPKDELICIVQNVSQITSSDWFFV